MKHLSRAILAVFLAILMGALLPVQVFADTPDYISEVKVFEGNFDSAEKEGYTILKGDDNKPIDLNQGSGSEDIGAKGNKAVYFGYKTTKDKDDAITDLALMNMKGGYDVAEYDKLMGDQMDYQIIPLVEGFLAAINEYRENYTSKNKTNQQRAQYIHDVLNKLTDDDCGGAGLGDLLLNETVYEMAKPKYDALSDKEKENTTFYDVNNGVRDSLTESEKNQHADILTIIAQSNGKATLMIENLITRAADTNDDTWLERFETTTYDDLTEIVGGTPKDAAKALAKMFDDDANDILGMWDDFRTFLLGYDEACERVDNYDDSKYQSALEAMQGVTKDTPEKEAQEIAEAFGEAEAEFLAIKSDLQCIAIHDALDEIDYEDGTMLDFFTMESADIEDDLTLLYPLVASLSDGQKSGLEFISLKEMTVIALTDENGYSDIELDDMQEISIYDGVDRGIYQKGGVALTSDAFRADALVKQQEEEGKSFSGWTIAMMAITGASFAAFVGSAISWGVYANKLSTLTKTVNNELAYYQMAYDWPFPADYRAGKWSLREVYENNPEWKTQMDALTANTKLCKGLTIGVGVAFLVISAVTIYLSYRDMKAYYNVDFTPIPHYMVDAKDLIGYNSKGEKIIRKNQSAYYKAVQSNRKKGDSYFNEIDTCADMNGCVNPQWLALYAAKNEAESPILASSLKVVVGSSEVPQGYETGIHYFGQKAAFNLNNKLYCWNQKATSVMVYYKVDETAATATGSNFSAGTLALAGGGGLLLGALATVLGMTATRKRKENKTVTV